MRNEADEILDDILSRWHSWGKHQGGVRGFAPCAAGMEQYRCSRQYDDVSGALDDDLEHRRCKQVDIDVLQMNQPHRSAIHVLARNLSTGYFVWANPRLPYDPEEREAIVREARVIIAKKLLASGVL